MVTTREVKSSELERKSFLGRAMNQFSEHRIACEFVMGLLAGVVAGYYKTPNEASTMNHAISMAYFGLAGGITIPTVTTITEYFSGLLDRIIA